MKQVIQTLLICVVLGFPHAAHAMRKKIVPTDAEVAALIAKIDHANEFTIDLKNEAQDIITRIERIGIGTNDIERINNAIQRLNKREQEQQAKQPGKLDYLKEQVNSVAQRINQFFNRGI